MILNKQEYHAIQDAYITHVQALFKTLITNLAGLGDEPDRDDQLDCVERFYNGIELARFAGKLIEQGQEAGKAEAHDQANGDRP